MEDEICGGKGFQGDEAVLANRKMSWSDAFTDLSLAVASFSVVGTQKLETCGEWCLQHTWVKNYQLKKVIQVNILCLYPRGNRMLYLKSRHPPSISSFPLCTYATPPLRGTACPSSLNLGWPVVALSSESVRRHSGSFLGSGFKIIGRFCFLSRGALSHQVRSLGSSAGDMCHVKEHGDTR